MRKVKFGRTFSRLFAIVKKWSTFQRQQNRQFSDEKLLEYKPGTKEYVLLQAAIKEISGTLTNIPICINEMNHCSKDLQHQYMPHNKRCKIAQLFTGNAKILEHCQKNAEEMKEEWNSVPMKERIEVCLACADILATEKRHLLNASIMLGQSKTYRQAEEDTCRTINNLRHCAEILTNLESSEFEKSCERDQRGYIMRSSGGFIAALTPYNWASRAISLAVCPALMGNCIVWVPSRRNVLSCYQIFLALIEAGLPTGVISFVPMNDAYFLYQITTMETLAGFSYAGTHSEYIWLANAISKYMDRPFSFSHMGGPTHNKNFHFVHESANIDQVAAATIQAAFDYNGQRGDSCERLFVPESIWCELQDALLEGIGKLKVGDVCDCETDISAVIDHRAYKAIVKTLKHAEMNENCKLLHGGKCNDTLGYFVEPTLVQCKTPGEEFMNRKIEGPLLSVYVYEHDQLDSLLKYVGSKENYTIAGSIFSGSEDTAFDLYESLCKGAANIYINKPCIGNMDGRCDAMPDLNYEVISDKKSLLKFW